MYNKTEIINPFLHYASCIFHLQKYLIFIISHDQLLISVVDKHSTTKSTKIKKTSMCWFSAEMHTTLDSFECITVHFPTDDWCSNITSNSHTLIRLYIAHFGAKLLHIGQLIHSENLKCHIIIYICLFFILITVFVAHI